MAGHQFSKLNYAGSIPVARIAVIPVSGGHNEAFEASDLGSIPNAGSQWKVISAWVEA